MFATRLRPETEAQLRNALVSFQSLCKFAEQMLMVQALGGGTKQSGIWEALANGIGTAARNQETQATEVHQRR